MKNASVLLALVLFLNPATLYADLVVNGDFETGDYSGWSWSPASGVTGDVVSFDVYGSDGPSLAFQANMTNAPYMVFSGLSQHIILRAGTTYTITWEMAMQNMGPDDLQQTGTIQVGITGQLLANWNQGVLNANSSTGLKESRFFTPDEDGSYELNFSFKRTANYGNSTVFMYVDNISVEVQARPSDFVLLRGFLIGGSLEHVFMSDNYQMQFNPGITLNTEEAPVWMTFNANLSTDSPISLGLKVETQADTPGLTATTEAWNWNTNSYDVVDVSETSFNNDTVITPALTPGDHVQSGTAAVHSRLGWRKTGLTLNFPWQTRLDQFVWVEE